MKYPQLEQTHGGIAVSFCPQFQHSGNVTPLKAFLMYANVAIISDPNESSIDDSKTRPNVTKNESLISFETVSVGLSFGRRRRFSPTNEHVLHVFGRQYSLVGPRAPLHLQP